MNYELAKKLKDAGFKGADIPYTNPNGSNDPRNGTIVSEPTLSFLIEACGDEFGELSKGNAKIDAKWTATGLPVTISAQGETPEEAVANLWLELNKNNE